MTLVYALIDPRDDAIRYVGSTTTRPKDRLYAHVSEARTHPPTKPVRRWIVDLLEDGERPRMEFLAEAGAGQDLGRIEEAFFQYFREHGCDLTNLTTPKSRPVRNRLGVEP